MKILLIHTYYQIRGGEDQVFEQEKELLSKENDVEILTFSNQGGFSGLKQFLRLKNNKESNKKVKTCIERFQPDVVHIHNLHFAGGWGIIRTIKSFNIPIVMTLHNYRLLCPSATLFTNNQLFLDSLQDGFPWQAVKKKVYKNSAFLTYWLAKVTDSITKNGTLDLVDRFIVLTPFAKDLYSNSKLKLQLSKTVVKPNFVKTPQFNSEIKGKENYFLFVGRLSEEKGIDVLLEAFASSDYKIKIAGVGPLLDKVKIFCNHYPNNFHYIGKLNSKEVAQEMNRASALIVPSIWLEPFGLVIIEAFSQSLPIIASNIGAMSSLIEDRGNGLHFKVGNAIDLREKLADWSKLSFSEKNEMGARAFQSYQENYTPEKNLVQLMNIYHDVLNENK